MEQKKTEDIIAVEKIIDSGLSHYPDTFDKEEAKRRLVDVYKKALADIKQAQDEIISRLIIEQHEKHEQESKKEKRRIANLFKKLS